MEYIFKTVLGRNEDFDDITPKTLFSQIEAHKKFNDPDSEKESNKEVGQVYIDSLL